MGCGVQQGGAVGGGAVGGGNGAGAGGSGEDSDAIALSMKDFVEIHFDENQRNIINSAKGITTSLYSIRKNHFQNQFGFDFDRAAMPTHDDHHHDHHRMSHQHHMPQIGYSKHDHHGLGLNPYAQVQVKAKDLQKEDRDQLLKEHHHIVEEFGHYGGSRRGSSELGYSHGHGHHRRGSGQGGKHVKALELPDIAGAHGAGRRGSTEGGSKRGSLNGSSKRGSLTGRNALCL